MACQASPSMGFSRQEYWGGLPFPPQRDLPDPGIESMSPAVPALTGRFFTTEPLGKPPKGMPYFTIPPMFYESPGASIFLPAIHAVVSLLN